MRIDKYLKVSRLIKRRTIAAEACDGGRVKLNGKTAKPGSTVKIDDIIEIVFGVKTIKIKVINILEHTKKDDAVSLYTVIEG